MQVLRLESAKVQAVAAPTSIAWRRRYLAVGLAYLIRASWVPMVMTPFLSRRLRHIVLIEAVSLQGLACSVRVSASAGDQSTRSSTQPGRAAGRFFT